MATTQASITIHDVNDSPPTFNRKNYVVSLAENTPVGTPLPIEMSVRDPDVVRINRLAYDFNCSRTVLKYFLFVSFSGTKCCLWFTFRRCIWCI